MKKHYSVVVDPKYIYRRLDPLPTKKELEHFYREHYYAFMETGGRVPELRRLIKGGEESDSELAWLSQTLWRDIRDILDEHLVHKQERWLLDMGCGPGHFCRYMQQAGWHVVGVEPSRDAAEIARSFGITVYDSIEECSRKTEQRFDAVTLLNVLEHVLDPPGLLQELRSLTHEESMLAVRVPNDFSVLQDCAYRRLGGGEPWWVAIPDHINYFNFETLAQFMERLGFQVVDMFGDFPMEVFLLFGDVYVGNPEVGSQCHEKRVAFELSIPVQLRRNLYRCFARNGVGRNCLLFAKMVK
ncbi:class I SAM-dependent methyltransferase [Candidatus Desulforudis audaxviator]|uniref:Methyltransferase type 12 n=1 Tax=Desulforudis audaxviator (strain MP104C) TaxID=477974 RepID=B1I5G1_DESAP|nr:class I SAM-dependent methyltransferase [Candidatus Desulforudis audaxviator]ACA60271.1 Methyltransferase type 12 [Candidatus Desulforudis audaxviator MP104C]